MESALGNQVCTEKGKKEARQKSIARSLEIAMRRFHEADIEQMLSILRSFEHLDRPTNRNCLQSMAGWVGWAWLGLAGLAKLVAILLLMEEMGREVPSGSSDAD